MSTQRTGAVVVLAARSTDERVCNDRREEGETVKVLISADMEGVTGVTCPDDCEPGHSRWSTVVGSSLAT